MNTTHPSRHYSSGPEPLEARIAPTGGIVNVSLTGGALTLQGDDAGNDVAITPEGFASIHLAATGGTVLSYQGRSVTELDLSQPTALKWISGAGDDTFSIEGMYKLKTLDVESASGQDSFTIQTVVVGWLTTVKEGDGQGSIALQGDSIFFGKTSVTASGTGNKTVTFRDNLEFRNDVTVTTAAGDDTISIFTNTLIATKNVTLDAGPGANAIAVGYFGLPDAAQVGGNLILIQGDHAEGTSTTTFVEGEATIKGALVLKEGAGTNTASVGTAGYLKVGSITATGGSGDNTFDFGSLPLLGSLTVTGGVTFDGTKGGLTALIALPNFTAGASR